MRFAMTYTRLRTEERMLLDAFELCGVSVEPIDLRQAVFDPSNADEWRQFDAVIERSVSLTAGLTCAHILGSWGVRCINPADVISVCSDKLATTLALERAGVPQPNVRIALSAESGLQAVGEIGYPAVLKPIVGSWGRLVSRVNDRDAADAVLEHRATLGSAMQHVVYAQEHIKKPERDIRVFVVGGSPIAAIVRSSQHWITNTARGARAEGLELTDELSDLAQRAARAAKADVVAVDVLECPERGLLVNELNHSMEFRNSVETTGVNIPLAVARYAIESTETSCPIDSSRNGEHTTCR